mmetsp:Transcript_52447/g.147201  ORF Transcript_52447/g.147201 Transcript_52447/m.147201 type:complete len:225 (-) Transcript_52447:212-886(-)
MYRSVSMRCRRSRTMSNLSSQLSWQRERPSGNSAGWLREPCKVVLPIRVSRSCWRRFSSKDFAELRSPSLTRERLFNASTSTTGTRSTPASRCTARRIIGTGDAAPVASRPSRICATFRMTLACGFRVARSGRGAAPSSSSSARGSLRRAPSSARPGSENFRDFCRTSSILASTAANSCRSASAVIGFTGVSKSDEERLSEKLMLRLGRRRGAPGKAPPCRSAP